MDRGNSVSPDRGRDQMDRARRSFREKNFSPERVAPVVAPMPIKVKPAPPPRKSCLSTQFKPILTKKVHAHEGSNTTLGGYYAHPSKCHTSFESTYISLKHVEEKSFAFTTKCPHTHTQFDKATLLKTGQIHQHLA